MNKNKCKRSMSKKGCSPDNSACEGFFGIIKNEFFYSKDWSKTGKEEFAIELDKYLTWFVNKRIKERLNYKSSKSIWKIIKSLNKCPHVLFYITILRFTRN